ncbi:MAG: carbonic anhydrase [Spirochaetaceae bacterium]
MENLFEGVKEFNKKKFSKYQDLFNDLSLIQTPHTLFISCCDSRIVPSLLTNSKPGEIFVVRNVANMVPFYQVKNEFLATTSAIEYAVCNLHVQNIVVCGHSNCGGCNAMYLDEEEISKTPHIKKWLELGNGIKKRVLEMNPKTEDEKHLLTEQLNIVEQMKHLLTYPYISKKVKNRELEILGWYYDIKTGSVFNYDKDKISFEKI